MKTCALTLLAMFAVPLLSGQARSASKVANAAPPVPAYCSPCLFYSGDFDPLNPKANALGNGVMLTEGVGPSSIYVPFVVPSGQVWTVRALFVNELASVEVLDPANVPWSISVGVSSGQAGTTIASGLGPGTLSPTGRSFDGMNEYTVMTRVKEFALQPGRYWLSVLPQCTNKEDPTCAEAEYFLTDVEDDPPQNFKGSSPADDSFWTYPHSGDYYLSTWGPLGACGKGCDRFSVGVIGTAEKTAY